MNADTLIYNEVVRQPYSDCVFSAGFVEGHPVDTMYLRVVRNDGSDLWELLLRPDEMAAIAWCATGVLWSHEISKNTEEEK
jgi:hypothetical protein